MAHSTWDLGTPHSAPPGAPRMSHQEAEPGLSWGKGCGGWRQVEEPRILGHPGGLSRGPTGSPSLCSIPPHPGHLHKWPPCAWQGLGEGGLCTQGGPHSFHLPGRTKPSGSVFQARPAEGRVPSSQSMINHSGNCGDVGEWGTGKEPAAHQGRVGRNPGPGLRWEGRGRSRWRGRNGRQQAEGLGGRTTGFQASVGALQACEWRLEGP